MVPGDRRHVGASEGDGRAVRAGPGLEGVARWRGVGQLFLWREEAGTCRSPLDALLCVRRTSCNVSFENFQRYPNVVFLAIYATLRPCVQKT